MNYRIPRLIRVDIQSCVKIVQTPLRSKQRDEGTDVERTTSAHHGNVYLHANHTFKLSSQTAKPNLTRLNLTSFHRVQHRLLRTRTAGWIPERLSNELLEASGAHPNSEVNIRAGPRPSRRTASMHCDVVTEM